MPNLNIALLQMTACGNDREANRVKGDEFCRRARAMGADIALFPEMWNIGYNLCETLEPEVIEAWKAHAIGPENPFILHFRKLAKELEMAIALTYLERWRGLPRNSVSLIDRRGEIVMTYAKIHTCDFDKEAALTPGEDFYVCSLDTAAGEVRIGAMICYDREFPESARVLMLKGAEIILVPNSCGLEAHRLAQFRTRAYENMVGLAMANYASPDCNGHSIAVDAVSFDEKENSVDALIIEAGEREGVYMAQFNVDRLRAYRAYEAWGNSYRKPYCYGILASSEVSEPFIRPDSRREKPKR